MSDLMPRFRDAVRMIAEGRYRDACGVLRPALEQHLKDQCEAHRVSPERDRVFDMINALSKAGKIDSVEMSRLITWNKLGNVGSHRSQTEVGRQDAEFFLSSLRQRLGYPESFLEPEKVSQLAVAKLVEGVKPTEKPKRVSAPRSSGRTAVNEARPLVVEAHAPLIQEGRIHPKIWVWKNVCIAHEVFLQHVGNCGLDVYFPSVVGKENQVYVRFFPRGRGKPEAIDSLVENYYDDITRALRPLGLADHRRADDRLGEKVAPPLWIFAEPELGSGSWSAQGVAGFSVERVRALAAAIPFQAATKHPQGG